VKGSEVFKDGVHIVIPDVVLNYPVQYAIRAEFLRSHADVFAAFSNEPDDIFDDAVIDRNNWLMYGSRKDGEACAWENTYTPCKVHFETKTRA
jgi:hypothetical protein